MICGVVFVAPSLLTSFGDLLLSCEKMSLSHNDLACYLAGYLSCALSNIIPILVLDVDAPSHI